MINSLDRSQKLLCFLLALTAACLLAMICSNTPFVMASRNGTTQEIPLSWIFPLAFLGLIVPFWLRNLGGLLSILSVGLIGGGTLSSCIYANESGSGIIVPWTQSLLCTVVLISSVVVVSRMNIDFTNVGVDDLLN